MTWDNRYRPLREGETILSGDECLTDTHLGWQPAKHDIGGKAPDPNYTAHRMYRRLRDTGLTAEPEVEQRIAILSDALKSISKNTCCDNCREAANVARSALAAYVGLARENSATLHALPGHDETMAAFDALTIRPGVTR